MCNDDVSIVTVCIAEVGMYDGRCSLPKEPVARTGG